MRAMIAGARAPQRLAALRHDRWKKAAAEIALALTGTGRAEHLVVRAHARARCACYTPQLRACDAPSERVFAVITPRFETPGAGAEAVPLAPPPRRTPHSHSKTTPEVNTRAHLRRIP